MPGGAQNGANAASRSTRNDALGVSNAFGAKTKGHDGAKVGVVTDSNDAEPTASKGPLESAAEAGSNAATPVVDVDAAADENSAAGQTRVDDEDSDLLPPRPKQASPQSSDGVDLETVRMPPPNDPARPIKVVRMVHDRGATLLRLSPKEELPTPLQYPSDPFGTFERALARGAVQVVRDEVSDDKLGTGPEFDDDQARYRDLLARVCIMDGDVQSARTLLEGLRGDARVSTADACIAVGDGDVTLAQKAARVALDCDPEGVVAHYVNALVCVAEGDYQRGFEELALVARASPEHAVARHQLGQLTYATGDPARAGTLFEQAAEIAPTFLPPSLTLAEMLIESRQYGEALAILNRAAEAAPDALAPRLLELRILLEVGDDESSVRLAEVLHRAAPHHPDVSRMWADAMLRAGRQAEAKDALEALLPTSMGAAKAQALRLLAKIDLSQGQGEKARARLFEAVASAPGDGELVLELSQALFRTGASEEAGEALFAFAKRPEADVSHLLSGAMLARENGDDDLLAALATAALQLVAGTPSEPQVQAVLNSIGIHLPSF